MTLLSETNKKSEQNTWISKSSKLWEAGNKESPYDCPSFHLECPGILPGGESSWTPVNLLKWRERGGFLEKPMQQGEIEKFIIIVIENRENKWNE